MKTILGTPTLRTSAMLFSEDYDTHLAIYKSLFSPDDVVLDVGCGPSGSVLGFDGIDIDYDSSRKGVTYDTLNFSESVGYIPGAELIRLISTIAPAKIVVKDFICFGDSTVPYFTYDFHRFYQALTPWLLRHGYLAEIESFIPCKERWKSLLAEAGLEYHPAPNILPVLGVFTK